MSIKPSTSRPALRPSSGTCIMAGAGGCELKPSNNPKNRHRSPMEAARTSPRCGAQTRSGPPCMAPAVNGKKRCRMHGGTNPGAPAGPANGNWRHGLYSREMLQMRRELNAARRGIRDMKVAKANSG
ncbi:HGGxSTG domain-containing protein [Phenylobacterium sp.]|uniref:HGGxSTG domain-containing protein n=1 Tax=Phenylobacterium sp. TaxID=1871053 RepID=UPI0038620E85